MSTSNNMTSRLGIEEGTLSWNRTSTPTTVLVAISSIFLVTYATTAINFWLSLNGEGPRLMAPVKPYWIPYLGNLGGFLYNPANFLQTIVTKYTPAFVPIHAKLGPEEMIILPGPQAIQTVFNSSRDLSTKALSMRVLVSCFGMPKEDAKCWEDDTSGTYLKPVEGSNVSPERRLFHLTHRNFQVTLSGSALDEINRQFIRVFSRSIAEVEEASKDDWIDYPDLFGFSKNLAFSATMTALCGEHFLRINPTFAEDFWTFDSWIPAFVRWTPRFLIPHAYRNRERVVDAIVRWHDFAREHLSPDDETFKDVLWEPIWGAKVLRERASIHDRVMELSKRGRATDELGMIWGANGNAVPAVGWTVFHVVSDKSLLAQVREEIAPWFPSRSPASADISKFQSSPLLQSIVAEVLRLYGTALIHRTSTIPDFKIGKYTIEQDKLIIGSQYVAHRDASSWNTGRTLPNGKQEHPLDTFWAERFLEYPDDPLSGPSRKDVTPEKLALSERAAHNVKDARYTTDDLKGVYIPWGGGMNLCPGRHYAKSEMALSAAMLLWAFDIELDEMAASKTRASMKAFALGTLSADKAVPFRLKKRVWSSSERVVVS